MKPDIHPKLKSITIPCACGNIIKTISTKDDIRVEVCSNCHPFYTGKRKIVDTAGRVEKFRKKYNLVDESEEANKEETDKSE